jgi:DNA polymerase
VTALPEGIADMSWPAVADAVAHCQACAMCLGRRASVITAPQGATPCDWMVVGDPPDESEERAGQSFVDDAGKLLDNMLRAVGVKRLVTDETATDGTGAAAGRAYLSHVLKCRPALSRAATGDELATCAHYLRREIALTQPKVILAMGRFAMQVLLSETPPERAKQPLGKLRGQVWRFAGVPVVVTYPPAYLLRSGQDKGKAWADLCLALDVARGDLPQAS